MTSDEIGACVGARFTELRGYDQAQITAFVGEQVNAALHFSWSEGSLGA